MDREVWWATVHGITKNQTWLKWMSLQVHPCYSKWHCFILFNVWVIFHMYYCCCCCCQVTSVVCDSVWPHRRQPTRIPRPWDSPGKNAGVGCHFLLQCTKVKVKVKSLSRVRPSATPWTAAFQAPPSMGFSRQEYWSGVPLSIPLSMDPTQYSFSPYFHWR